MTRRHRRTILLSIAWMLILTLSCAPLRQAMPRRTAAGQPTREPNSNPTPTPTSAPASAGVLDLGEAVTLVDATIGPADGKVEVSSPGDPLHGLSIEVPPGAFASDVTLAIASREVQSHSLGRLFDPVSPLIEIRGAETLTGELLTISIPIEIGADKFAMGFAYEAASGAVDGLALLESTPDSVTVATRDISRDVLVSAVLVDELYGGSDSGFEHGVDDWYFPNHGSYISPGGHCAGQSISAMYYYIEELGQPLYGLYDNYDNGYRETPDLWQDDELGYKLASTAQERLDWDGYGRKFWSLFNRKYNDPVIYNAFAYSMLLTGLPQFVGIYGTDEDGEVFGHALIAYRMEDNKLYVSDPNFPAWSEGGIEERSITFDPATGRFKPYPSGAMASDLGAMYDVVMYFGYKDLIDWGLMGELWSGLEEGWIGDEEFPAYELAVRQADSEIWDELWTNYESEGKDIVVKARDADFLAILNVRDASGNNLGGNTEVAIELRDGDNWLGINILAGIPSGDKVKLRWVGFDWIKVIYEAPEMPELDSLDLCDLLPPGGEGVRRDDFGCTQSYTHSDGFSSVQISRAPGGSERACQQWEQSAFNTVIKTLNVGDCGYITAYTDPDSGKVIAGNGAAWTAFFAVGDFRVLVNSGTGAEYPARSVWVMDRVADVQERLRELAGVDW
jgi:hypothetical protein